MKSQKFHLGDILSIYTGRLLSREHMDGVYKILNHMTGENLSTVALGGASDQAKPALEKQFPWLKDASAQVDADFAAGNVETTQAGIDKYVSSLGQVYGEYHSVKPMGKSYSPAALADSVRGLLKGKTVIEVRAKESDEKDLMQRSIDQGVAHLRKDKSKIVFNIESGFNFAVPETEAAKRFEAALDEGVGHSGASFGYALKGAFAAAEQKLGARVSYLDDRGNVLPARKGDATVPKGTSRIVLGF